MWVWGWGCGGRGGCKCGGGGGGTCRCACRWGYGCGCGYMWVGGQTFRVKLERLMRHFKIVRFVYLTCMRWYKVVTGMKL